MLAVATEGAVGGDLGEVAQTASWTFTMFGLTAAGTEEPLVQVASTSPPEPSEATSSTGFSSER